MTTRDISVSELWENEIDLQTSGLMRCHNHRRWQDFLYPAKYSKPEEQKKMPQMFDLPKIDIPPEINEKCRVLYIRYMSPNTKKLTYKNLLRLLKGLGMTVDEDELYEHLRTHNLMTASEFCYGDVCSIILQFEDRVNLDFIPSPDILEPQNSLVPFPELDNSEAPPPTVSQEFSLAANPSLPIIEKPPTKVKVTSLLSGSKSESRMNTMTSTAIYRGIDQKKDDAITKSLRSYMSNRKTDIKHCLKPVDRLTYVPLQKDIIDSKLYSENKEIDDKLLEVYERRRIEKENERRRKEMREKNIAFSSDIHHLQKNAFLRKIQIVEKEHYIDTHILAHKHKQNELISLANGRKRKMEVVNKIKQKAREDKIKSKFALHTMKLEEATKLALNRDLVRARHVNTRNKKSNTPKSSGAPLSINTIDSNVLEQDPVLYNNSIIQQILSLNSASYPSIPTGSKQSTSSQPSLIPNNSSSADTNNTKKSSKKYKRLSKTSSNESKKESALFTLKPGGVEFSGLDDEWIGQYEDNFDDNPDSERKLYNEDGEEIKPDPIVIPS